MLVNCLLLLVWVKGNTNRTGLSAIYCRHVPVFELLWNPCFSAIRFFVREFLPINPPQSFSAAFMAAQGLPSALYNVSHSNSLSSLKRAAVDATMSFPLHNKPFTSALPLVNIYRHINKPAAGVSGMAWADTSLKEISRQNTTQEHVCQMNHR